MNKERKKLNVLGLVFLCLLCLSSPLISYGETKAENRTDVGVGFTKASSSDTSSSSSHQTSPSVPENTHSKPVGRLPMTGELLQPIMFVLIGWFLVILLWFIVGKRKKKEEEEL